MKPVVSRLRPASPRRLAARAGLLLVLVALAIGASTIFTSQREGRVAVDAIGADESVKNRLDVTLLARTVDASAQEVRLRMYVAPIGSFADAKGHFARAVAIDSSNESDKGVLKFEVGSVPVVTEFIASFEQGEDVSYPFDRYAGSVWLEATDTTDPSAQGGPPSVPIRLRFEAADSNFRYAIADRGDEVQPEFKLTVQRSPLVRGVAITLIALMWALGISVGIIAWYVVRYERWRHRAFESLAWMAAMLFALVELRGASPGVPAFGTLFDFAGFFWAEIITAVSLCAVVATQVRAERTRSTPAPATEDDEHS